MRPVARGFTLLEVMVVAVVLLLLGGLVVWYGRSARQAATLASGAYELSLRIGGLKGRAMSTGEDHVLVVTDALDPAGCVHDAQRCGRVLVFRNPQPGFTVQNLNPDPPYAGADFDERELLPRNSRFDLASPWRPPLPFNAIAPWDPSIRTTCAGGIACFGIRFRADGTVRAETPGPPDRPGFAFVLAPQEALSAAAERRGLFVSFPTGIVKTGAF